MAKIHKGRIKEQGIAYPTNRWEVFFDLCFHRFFFLVKLSLLSGLFFLPLAVLHCYFWSLEAIDPSQEGASQLLISLHLWQYLLQIPALLIASLGVVGGLAVTKKLVWAEMSFLGHDFFAGIKNGWKLGLGTFAGVGLSSAVLYFGLAYGTAQKGFLSYLCAGASILQFLFVIWETFFVLTQNQIYSLSIGGYFANGWRLVFKEFPVNLFFFVLLAAPLSVFFFFDNLLVWMGGFAFLLFFGLSYAFLVIVLWNNYVYDKYLNKEFYPTIVDKGIHRVSKDSLSEKKPK
jgi:hypothetical protein